MIFMNESTNTSHKFSRVHKIGFPGSWGDLHRARPWLRYYRRSAVQTAEMTARSCLKKKLKEALSAAYVRHRLVTPAGPAARERARSTANRCWREGCIFLTSCDSQKNSNRLNAPFHFFMILKNNVRRSFSTVWYFFLPCLLFTLEILKTLRSSKVKTERVSVVHWRVSCPSSKTLLVSQ